jgi:hypothetical protein
MTTRLAGIVLLACLATGCARRAPSAAEALTALTPLFEMSGLSTPVLTADSPTTYVGSATGPNGVRWELTAGMRDGKLHYVARTSSGVEEKTGWVEIR